MFLEAMKHMSNNDIYKCINPYFVFYISNTKIFYIPNDKQNYIDTNDENNKKSSAIN